METILEKDKMDAMKALADTNMKVSEAKAYLAKIKAEEILYLGEREKKTLKAIEIIVADSASLLKEAKGNYEEVQSLYRTVSGFVQFLAESQRRFSETVGLFEERGKLWDQEVKRQNENIAAHRQELEADKKRLKNDYESFARAEKQLSLDKIRLEDDRKELERAIIRLKSNKI